MNSYGLQHPIGKPLRGVETSSLLVDDLGLGLGPMDYGRVLSRFERAEMADSTRQMAGTE